MAIKRYVGDKYVGLSTDVKPLDVDDGADFIEIDSTVLVEDNPEIDIWIKKDGDWIPLGIPSLWNAIDKLTPDLPDGLSGKAILISGFYTALESGTGTSHNYCTSDRTPTGSVSNFYDGDTGILSANIDSGEVGSRILTTTDDTGVYSYLRITDDYDPFVGIPGKEGFYKVLDSNITPSANLTYAQHTYQLLHSVTGNSLIKTLYVDDPDTVTISSITYTLPGASTGWTSGVPSLVSGDTISFDFNVVNAVRKHYHPTRLALISSSYTTSNTCAPPGTPPIEGATVAYTNRTITVSDGIYTENLNVSIRGYNSKNIGGTLSNQNTGARVDTVSDESLRRISGSGQYPSTGYGGAFISTTSLLTTYTEELQMLNGIYQIPLGDYTGNLPTAGPDYSTGMGSSVRWVTFPMVTLSNDLAFTLTFNNPTGTWSGTETSNIQIYAKVEGITGWIDANAPYPGVGTPVNDGDPAMVFGSSSVYVKRVTLGIVRSGILYVRVGLPIGSDKKFTGITISDIN